MRSDKASAIALKKLIPILHTIGEGIDHLHKNGIIHGAVSIASVGRFGHDWKLTNLAGSRRVKSSFGPHRMALAPPPGKHFHIIDSIHPVYFIFLKFTFATFNPNR